MTPRREWVLVLLLALAGIAWNSIGLARLLPYAPEPDNYVAVQLADLEAGTPVAERVDKFRSYPLLMANLARIVPAPDPLAAGTLEEHLAAASDVSIRARIVAILLSSLLGPATYLLARRFLAWPAALAAALFASTSLLHQLFASQGRPHGPHVALGVLAVLAALEVRRAPSWRSYLVAGLACAAASVTLQTGWFTLLSLFFAHGLAERRPGRWTRFGVAVGLVLLVAWICAPDAPAAPKDVGLRGTQLRIGSHYFELVHLNGRGFGDCVWQLWMHDPVLLVLGLAGLASALPAWKRWKSDPDVAVVAIHGLVYLALWGTYGWTYDRYWLPLVPYLAVLAAR